MQQFNRFRFIISVLTATEVSYFRPARTSIEADHVVQDTTSAPYSLPFGIAILVGANSTHASDGPNR